MSVSHSSTTPHASSLKIIQALAFIDLMGTNGHNFPVCGPNKRNSDSVSESGSGKVEAPFLGLFLEKPAMLLPVTAPMPSRKQCNKMSFKKGV